MNRRSQDRDAMWGWEEYREASSYEYQEETPYYMNSNNNNNIQNQWGYDSFSYQGDEWGYQEEPLYNEMSINYNPIALGLNEIKSMMQEYLDQHARSRAETLEKLDFPNEINTTQTFNEPSNSDEKAIENSTYRYVETGFCETNKSSPIVCSASTEMKPEVQPEEDDEPEFCYAGDVLSAIILKSEAEEVNLEEDNGQRTLAEVLELWKLVEEFRVISGNKELKRKYYGMEPDEEEVEPNNWEDVYDLEWMFSSDGKTREVEMLDEDDLSSNGKTRESGASMEKVVPSNGKSRATTGQEKDKGPSLEFNPPPKRVKVHEGAPLYLGKDPGKSLRPSHKLKEKVNSKCSQVWRVKKTTSSRAFLERNKSGGGQDSKNKRFKSGWDPPAIPSF